MSDRPRTRQELYERIRTMGREAFILEEMIRYGFWPAEGTIADDPADEIRRQGELQKELERLRQENRRLYDEKALRREALKQRLAESRRKQQETKERRERQRLERAQAWQQRQQQEIVYLGEGVSGGLSEHQSQIERLQSYGLPIYETAADLAAAMGVSIGQLRFLAFNRKTSKVCHYIRFTIPKKTGGERLISAPMPRLKQAQSWIYQQILAKIPLEAAAHGFRCDRSILTNAHPHLEADVIINLDLKDFFPSISYQRVKGLFRSFGYCEAVATILGLICTEANLTPVELDGVTYYVATTERFLPQGSPASPAISNLICRRLDRRLTQMAQDLGFTYTRYADDLTFSAHEPYLQGICNILRRTEAIVAHEGLTINDQKTRILRKKSSQLDVTGIVVNGDRPSLDRKTLKRFRATLHQIEQNGPTGQHWGHTENVMSAIAGYANYVASVLPEKGAKFQEQVRHIHQKWQRLP
ncbi:reverse transcriptase domain-containing protein [Geitlerinema splendidum]|nr:reverse transcriptase domain-containing protein [Geitlerinema splendidum]